MLVDYNEQSCYTKTLDLVDLGNTAIRATNEADCLDYYIIVKTVMGKTSILKFGPVMPDTKMLLNGFALDYQNIDYKEKSIIKSINLFINDSRKKITDAIELTEFEALEALPDFSTGIMEN